MKKLNILAGVATTALFAGVAANDVEFRIAFDRKFQFPSRVQDEELEAAINASVQKGIQFFNGLDPEVIERKNDQNTLIKARFLKAKEESNKYIILSHGYRNYGLQEFGAFFPFYYEQNVNILLLDHQAHGESEGRYITFGYQEHKDVLTWIDYLVERFGSSIQVYLHGVSMGAATILQISGLPSLQPQVKGLISDCGYTDAKTQLCHTMALYHVPLKEATYKLIVARLKRKYNAIIDEVKPVEMVKNCQRPIVFIHGKEDDFVPTQMGIECFDVCGSKDKNILLVEQARHAQSYWFAREQYEKEIVKILNKE